MAISKGPPPRKIGGLGRFKELVKNGPKTFKEGLFLKIFCVLDARQQADLMFSVLKNANSLNVYSLRDSILTNFQKHCVSCFQPMF